MRALGLPPTRAVAITLAALLAGVAVVLWCSPPQVAHAASAGQLRQRITAGQGRAQSLAGAVRSASGQLSRLRATIAPLEARLTSLQADLAAKQTALFKLQSELISARARLSKLEAFEARAEGVLARQLVATYEFPRPDLVTVVLQAHGFTDLLERLAFAARIQTQDVQVVTEVRAARRAVAAQATRLGGLEVRQQQLTLQVLAQRNALASTRLTLLRQQLATARSRSAAASRLAAVRAQVVDLQKQLSRIVAQQTAAAPPSGPAAPPPGPAGAPGSAGPSPQVSQGGGFTFPLPKGAASPPGTWSLDDGVDISAPGHTPLLAVGSGTIVLHGIGGFGPWAPVLHLDSGQYVYYGHAGPGNELAVGTHVGAGQVIGEVGAGIVGISSGPHLELGFCDSSGTPLGPSTAPQMMSLLQGSY